MRPFFERRRLEEKIGNIRILENKSKLLFVYNNFVKFSKDVHKISKNIIKII